MKMDIEVYISYAKQYAGYCQTCNAITEESGVESDAENYECSQCGEHTVCGVEQAMLKGLIEVEE